MKTLTKVIRRLFHRHHLKKQLHTVPQVDPSLLPPTLKVTVNYIPRQRRSSSSLSPTSSTTTGPAPNAPSRELALAQWQKHRLAREASKPLSADDIHQAAAKLFNKKK